MTPQTLHAHLRTLGLSAGGFARLIGVSKRTVERYLSGAVAIPGPVERLSDLMMFQALHKDVGIRATLEVWAQKNIHTTLARLTAIGQASGDYEGGENKSSPSDKMS